MRSPCLWSQRLLILAVVYLGGILHSASHTLIFYDKSTSTVCGRLVRGFLLQAHKTVFRVHQNTTFLFQKNSKIFLGRGTAPCEAWPLFQIRNTPLDNLVLSSFSSIRKKRIRMTVRQNNTACLCAWQWHCDVLAQVPLTRASTRWRLRLWYQSQSCSVTCLCLLNIDESFCAVPVELERPSLHTS